MSTCSTVTECDSSQDVLIIKGSTYTLDIQFIDESDQPVNLSGFVTGMARFQDENDSIIVVSGSLLSADLGVVRYQISSVVSDQLKAVEEGSAEFEAQVPGATYIVQLLDQVTIRERLFGG